MGSDVKIGRRAGDLVVVDAAALGSAGRQQFKIAVLILGEFVHERDLGRNE